MNLHKEKRKIMSVRTCMFVWLTDDFYVLVHNVATYLSNITAMSKMDQM